jgi:MATE family multidrug resistance protein
MMWMSVTLHWLMLLAQYLVIKVFELTPLVSWSVFVLMILVTAGIYLWRIQGQAWRSPEAIAKVMAEH